MIQVEFIAPAGLTLSASIFAVNSDAVAATASSVTEQPNTKGAYVAEFTSAPDGAHLLVAYDEAASPAIAVAAAYVLIAAATSPLRSGHYADVVAAASIDGLRKLAANKTITNPSSGTLQVFDDDDATLIYEAPLWEDVAETQPYRGQGAEVRGKLVAP